MTHIDPSDALRVAADYGLLGRVLLGECPIAAYVVEMVNDQINFDTLPSITPTITKTRITVAEGYISFAPGDGYLNPPIKQLSAEQISLSGGVLTDNMVVLGPLTFPYTSIGPGGTDPNIFQPSITNGQTYVLLQGPGFNSTNGNYFEIKQIMLDDMKHITYHVLLKATASNPFS